MRHAWGLAWTVLILQWMGTTSKVVVDFYFPTELPDVGTEVIAAGSSFAAQTYQNAFFAYAFVNSEARFQYTSLSSSRGLCRVTSYSTECNEELDPQSDVDFAGSDSLVTEKYASYKDLRLFPTMAGAVVPVFNLPGTDDTVFFSKLNLVDIFSGKLTHWNDTRLVNDQSAKVQTLLANTNRSIEVVVRSTKSGTTEIFKTALNSFSPTWAEMFDDPSDAYSGSTIWPISNATMGDGNEGVGALVASTPFSIGYVVYKEAINVGLQMAAVGRENFHVFASPESVALAVEEKGTTFDNPSNLKANKYTAVLADPFNPYAWPISGYTYLAVLTNTLRPGTTCEYRYNLVQFWEWFWTSAVSSKLQVEAGFVNLPNKARSIVMKSFAGEMLCQNQTIYYNPMEGYGVDFLASAMSLLGATYGVVQSAAQPSYNGMNSEKAYQAWKSNTQSYVVVRTSGFEGKLNQPGQIHLPFALSSIIFAFNLCGAAPSKPCLGMQSGSDLYQSLGLVSLNEEMIVQVLSGEITNWRNLSAALVKAGLEPVDGSVNSILSQLDEPIILLGRDPPAEEAVILEYILGPNFHFSPSLKSFSSVDQVKAAAYATPFSFAVIPDAEELKNILQVISYRHASGAVVAASPESLRACTDAGAYTPLKRKHGNLSATFHPSQSTSDNCYPISEAFNLVVSSSVIEPSGDGGFDVCESWGTTTIEYMYWLVSNADIQLQLQSTNLFGLVGAEAPLFHDDLKTTFLQVQCGGDSFFASNRTDYTVVPTKYKVAGVSLACCGICAVLFFTVWVMHNRETHLMRKSQPLYLILTLLGILLSIASVFPMAIDDKGFLFEIRNPDQLWKRNASNACFAQVLLYTMGQTMVVGALVAKMWRLFKIFKRENPMQRVAVSAFQVIHVFLAVLLVNCTLVIAWELTSPLEWKRMIIETVAENNGDEKHMSVGYCASPDSWFFLAPLVTLNLFVIVAANVLCYLLRHVPSEFNEGKHISFALFSTLQLFMVGIPVISITYDPPIPTALFATKSGIVMAQGLSQLVIMFFPKFYYMYSDDRASFTMHDSTAFISALRRTSQRPQRTTNKASSSTEGHPHDSKSRGVESPLFVNGGERARSKENGTVPSQPAQQEQAIELRSNSVPGVSSA